MKNILFGILLFTTSIGATQKNTVAIDLETVLRLGGANNLTIREFRERQELAGAELSKAREWWLPDIYTGIAMHQLWGSAMNTDGSFITDFHRDNFRAGASMYTVWDFGEGIYKVKAANLRAQASTYRTQTERNRALLQSMEAYYELLVAQLNYSAYEQLTAQADTIAKQVEFQVNSGLRYESEMLLAKSNSNHLKVEMLNARSDYASASARLVHLLNLNPMVQLVVSDTLIAPIQLIPDESLVSFDTSYQKRPELKGMELMLQSFVEEKRTVTTALLFPELHIGTSSGYFGDVFSPLNPTNELNAAIVWRIPLGRLIYGGEVKKFDSRIEIHRTQMTQFKSRVNREILEAREVMVVAREQTEVASDGTLFAAEALRQSIARQALGTVRPFEILQAQEMYLKSRLDYLKAVSAYNKAQYKLYVAMGNNL